MNDDERTASKAVLEATPAAAPNASDNPKAAPESIPAVVPEVLPTENEQRRLRKAKGAAQMAAGGILAAAGVPMLVLPGPGAAAIVGGAALISKGNRNFTGRAATPAEESLDNAAAKAAEVTKEAAKKTGAKAANAAITAARAAKPVAIGTAKLAAKGIGEAAHIAKRVARNLPV